MKLDMDAIIKRIDKNLPPEIRGYYQEGAKAKFSGMKLNAYVMARKIYPETVDNQAKCRRICRQVAFQCAIPEDAHLSYLEFEDWVEGRIKAFGGEVRRMDREKILAEIRAEMEGK